MDLRIVDQGLGDGIEALEHSIAVGFGDLEEKRGSVWCEARSGR